MFAVAEDILQCDIAAQLEGHGVVSRTLSRGDVVTKRRHIEVHRTRTSSKLSLAISSSLGNEGSRGIEPHTFYARAALAQVRIIHEQKILEQIVWSISRTETIGSIVRVVVLLPVGRVRGIAVAMIAI